MRKILLLLALVAIPLPAYAAQTGPRLLTLKSNAAVLTAVRADTNPVITLETGVPDGFAFVVVMIELTRSFATAITMTCTGSDDDNVTNYILQECDLATAGTCDSKDATFTKTVSGNKKWPWRVGTLGFKDVQCTFGHTAAVAGDLLTVATRLVTQ